MTVLGDTAANALLGQLGYEVCSNVRPEAGQLVLIAVLAQEGLMPVTVGALDLAAGCEADHVAVLLSNVGAVTDRELVELTELETTHWLDGAQVLERGVAGRLPVLRSDDPHLGERIADIVRSPQGPIRFSAPDPDD